ncbi:hypothetical protein DFS33DRAFT_1104419 [Desarmillaria ectypa]|nr:hypothetical protein DFS33DRAFT_1104419 [Desarmillaria ectypa]
MRFWFFSRSHVFVTRAFKFISVQFTTSHTLYCIPAFTSLQDLGFDPTIQRVAIPIQESAKTVVQYAIRYGCYIGGQVYRTMDTPSPPRASLISRDGWVWKVHRVGDLEDKYYALKDVWIAHDATTDGKISTVVTFRKYPEPRDRRGELQTAPY